MIGTLTPGLSSGAQVPHQVERLSGYGEDVGTARCTRLESLGRTDDRKYLCFRRATHADTVQPPQHLSNCNEALRKYEKMKEEREARVAAKRAKAKAKAKKARAPPPDADDDDEGDDGDDAADQGVSMKELDARRAEAKERAKAKSAFSPPLCGHVHHAPS